MKNTYKIIENVNNGIIVNKIFTEWMNIKTQEQHDKVMNKIKKIRFGTYENKTILDVIESFGKTICNEIIKNDFIKESTRVLN